MSSPGARPPVSIIVPCRNEEERIEGLLEGILAQTYPHRAMEVIIADGASEDRTRERIEAFRRRADFELRVVENPERTIPSGLNRALAAAAGEIVVRLDAHSVPAPDYVARSVEALEEGRGDNVGGIWEVKPGGPGAVARAIAAAASHPLGAGDARYRVGGSAGEVETVPFGAFRRETLERLGGYDRGLLANEDYELNLRLREAGGVVWLDPRIRSTYFARPNLGALARQYWRYGFWKAGVIRRHPGSLRWRQALPPLFVLVLAGTLVAAAAAPLGRILAALMLGGYLLVLAAGGLHAAWRRRDAGLLPFFPVAVAVMHLAWGSGFLWGTLRSLLERPRRAG